MSSSGETPKEALNEGEYWRPMNEGKDRIEISGQRNNARQDATALQVSDELLHGHSTEDNVTELAALLRRRELPEDSSYSSVMFANLCAWQKGTGIGLQPTVRDLVLAPLKVVRDLFLRHHKVERSTLYGLEGVVQAGEMLLVLGRPSSASSTLLRALAGVNDSGQRWKGQIQYNGLDIHTFKSHFPGDSIYIPDVDVHFPHLSVGDTLDFASETKTPRPKIDNSAPAQSIRALTDLYTKLFGMQHTLFTKVGNDYVRGLSGGERKRVSLAEALATRSSVMILDNATHGLDSSTVHGLISLMRAMATRFGKTIVVSLYQAGENLIDEFDKVCLLYQGSQIFFGRVVDAADYFDELGLLRHPQQTTADFLTAMTDPTARTAKNGWESRVPRSAEDFVKLWKASPHYIIQQKELCAYVEAHRNHEAELEKYQAYRSMTKAKRQRQRSIYNVDLRTQFYANTRRAIQRLIGDKAYLGATGFSSVFMALIMGSLFFSVPESTSGFFSKGGALFFAILFNSLQTMTEINTMYDQRPIIRRQRTYAMYHPFIDTLATVLVDDLYRLFNSMVFNIIFYFMVGLKASAGAFFIFCLITYVSALIISAYFRSVATFTDTSEAAFSVAGISVLVFVIYTGYMVPGPSMHPWFKWLIYINPLQYAFASLVANEFHSLKAPCDILVPSGPGYQNVSLEHQVCAVTGAGPGQKLVNGDDYIQVSFDYNYSHVWRNFGILCAFLLGFLVLFAVATEWKMSGAERTEEKLMYLRGHEPESVKKALKAGRSPDDTEAQTYNAPLTEISATVSRSGGIVKTKNLFTWQDITYDITLSNGSNRRLLDNITGYIKPGSLTALMGASGAGKTTLLRVLAAPVNVGVVGGRCYVNGSPPGRSFRRMTGYVQQQDVHLESSTVREGMQFSTKLRQAKETPLAEKLDYVETVIEMLEMQDFADAIVGTPGDGLNLEQRKRLTIAVEVVAKPEILLFLDEPTSGLDSLSAWSIVRLIRKLADSGQAVLCTIHQPSSMIFEQFDRLLLLAKGGKTVYFGDIGDQSQEVIQYFESNGGESCPRNANPAEYILNVIGADSKSDLKFNWNAVWTKSPEYEKVHREIRSLHNEYAIVHPPSAKHHADSFGSDYAECWSTQFRAVQSRLFLHYWRTPGFIMAKLMLNILAGLFLGFTFYKEANSLQGMQNKLFAVFAAVILTMPLMNQFQHQFYTMAQLYTAREKPSYMYRWTTFVIPLMVTEICFNLVCTTLFFLPWYFAIGFHEDGTQAQNGERGVYMWLMLMLFTMWFSTFAVSMGALAPNAETAATLITLFSSFVLAFNGVLQPFSQLPQFWHFMYRASPFTYLMAGLVANGVHGTAIVCAPHEINVFQPPWARHVLNMLAFSSAAPEEVCSTPSQLWIYLASRNMFYSERWRNLAILAGFVLFNVFMASAFFYLVKVALFNVGSVKVWVRKDPKEEREKGGNVDEKTDAWAEA
ncbi:hypothetical protein A1O1_06137 [Capronia coronata CBS 617.96]|uniref:ABC transporter domain-containing protein n=1 Tax=Capronia coronata CBS 617.96 TaxID=1182541 RepID=W9YU11_9EURO|nr:uncharacterized protein A1O1_06137 [Capronia coronata CBS 617.96]EXJ85769.1 hypothetical protein A1O1_06137 [Capronia coronata CBS 617.96]